MRLYFKSLRVNLMRNTIENVSIKKKKIKNFNLRITPDRSVILSVPLRTTNKDIEDFLTLKKDWIEKHLKYFNNNTNHLNKNYLTGEPFLYLGKSYALEIVKSDMENVEISEDKIYIFVSDIDNKTRKKNLLEEWLKKESQIKFNEILINTLNLFKESNDVEFRIRLMKTMWGSCNKLKRKITLNSKLIHEREEFIEYVIAHEVAHLKYPNHSKDFYAWLELHMPNWKKAQGKN